MTAKANWFVERAPDLDDEQDPFSVPVEEVGQRFDLRDPKAALELRLRELVTREGRLCTGGTTCSIKELPDTTCHACPVSKAHDRESRLGVLCRLGREQESVLTELAVLSCQGR